MTEQNGPIHNQVVELLAVYIDGEVTPDERALVEAHLATCRACAHDLATLRQTVSLLRNLPQVAAPRPFTLRETDITPIRPARPAWWRLPWAQGLVAAAAMLVCGVVVGGVLLLGRAGMVGAPAAPESVALQAPAPTRAAAENMAAEKAVEVEVEKEEQKGVALATAPSTASVEATPELGMLQEAPAEAARVESESLADEGAIPMPTPSPLAAASGVPSPASAPAPLAPALLEIEDLNLEIEPGVIRVGGRLPLPEGRKLLAELWQDGQLIEWATPDSQRVTVEANGQVSLELRAQPDLSDFDLFGVEPAYYEIRIHPVDPPEPVEARIPFDTYGPPPPPPTSSP